ncbi:hypothetical protein [Sinorhizobium americanum]|uniref:hypothetical protein n=1 Tax=Sinorhizobium americanum TaxID=194963 RepID=UPI0012EC2BF1|nr:hypothetical protein [Sinorhizobium americanum]
MNRFVKRSHQRRPKQTDDRAEIVVCAVGLIVLLAAITLGTWFVGDLYVGAQAGAVTFIGGWCAFALYAASADGARQGRLLPPLPTWLKFAAPIVAACGVLWLASGRWN